MLYRREGYPEEGEIVLCTVTKVNPNSVFANLNEYGKSGMIHISEISPGRIRNIRDYVAENKVIVCKILKINRERGHIDLSLRRVNETVKRNKLSEVKHEQVAEKITEIVAKNAKKDPKKVYEEIAKVVLAEYDMLHHAFIEVSQGKIKISDLKVPKAYEKELEEQIKKRFKPEKIEVGGILKLQTYADNGVDILKKTLKTVEEVAEIRYLGAGNYRVKIESENAKKDEKELDKKVEEAIKFIEKNNGTGSFIKEAAEE